MTTGTPPLQSSCLKEKLVSLRLVPGVLSQVQHLASNRGIWHQPLIRPWVAASPS